ncbi:MAG: NTP transferase domain-containing protein [Fervidicoccaceae archaeon]|nr:NTP transferase domain-containing protein [Fervidicoccaceae archaeon]
MSIRKVLVPAAGLGTRLLPATKETPKEMLPIFTVFKGKIVTKPLLQAVFEDLYSKGFREFCFVVGRGKRAIEDHFTPDFGFLDELRRRGKIFEVEMLEDFYGKIRSSRIVWINQLEPRGFGDAVLSAEPYIDGEPFAVHAGDTLFLSDDNWERLREVFEKESLGAAFLVKEVENPTMYGVVVPGEDVGDSVRVKGVIEKPEKPPSKLAIMPLYVFDPIVLKALKVVKPGPRGEIELTDAIQKIIDWGFEVRAVKLRESDRVLDIGTPETYREALMLSYEFSRKKQ